MSTAAKPSKPVSHRRAQDRRAERASRIVKAAAAGTRTQRHSSTEAQQTIEAIRAGLVDALVIHGDDSDRLYAVRSFTEIERTQAALKNAGAARRRVDLRTPPEVPPRPLQILGRVDLLPGKAAHVGDARGQAALRPARV